MFKSTKRAAKYLRKHNTEAFEEAVNEMGLSAPGKMSGIQIAVMWNAGNVSGREQRRMILRHLRHHFGKGCFEPEYKVEVLCDGHTPITHKSIQYTYEDGEQEETIDFDYKDIALEVVAQLTRHLQALNITPDMAKSIDAITGADHGILERSLLAVELLLPYISLHLLTRMKPRPRKTMIPSASRSL